MKLLYKYRVPITTYKLPQSYYLLLLFLLILLYNYNHIFLHYSIPSLQLTCTIVMASTKTVKRSSAESSGRSGDGDGGGGGARADSATATATATPLYDTSGGGGDGGGVDDDEPNLERFNDNNFDDNSFESEAHFGDLSTLEIANDTTLNIASYHHNKHKHIFFPRGTTGGTFLETVFAKFYETCEVYSHLDMLFSILDYNGKPCNVI